MSSRPSPKPATSGRTHRSYLEAIDQGCTGIRKTNISTSAKTPAAQRTNVKPQMQSHTPPLHRVGPAPSSASNVPPPPAGTANERTPITAFISGPLEADASYFETHYAPRITTAIEAGHHFILGPSRGIDSLALDFLLEAGVDGKRIQVYLSPPQARDPKLRHSRRMKTFEQAGGIVVVFSPPGGAVRGGGPNQMHTERDEAMTRASHYDILRYRTEEECRALYGAKYRKRVSGTEKNELRRKTGIGLVYDESSVH